MNTLLLDQQTWDLTLDAAGNIAMASNPYAMAQDVASAIKTFAGDLYYLPTAGIPYLSNILGQLPPISYVRAQVEAAALTVPGVVSATAYFDALTDRVLTGQVLTSDQSGGTQVVGF